MLTWNDVRQISDKFIMENTHIPNDDPGEDVSKDILRIVFRIDIFECGGDTVIDRHIDIEYFFGEYYEVNEGTALFRYISSLCSLPLQQEEQGEIVIYQKCQEEEGLEC